MRKEDINKINFKPKKVILNQVKIIKMKLNKDLKDKEPK